MPAHERPLGWWPRTVRWLDALANAAEPDLHAEHRRRLAAIEERLDALDRASRRGPVDANADARIH